MNVLTLRRQGCADRVGLPRVGSAFCDLLFSAVDRVGLCALNIQHDVEMALRIAYSMANCVIYFSAETAQYNWKEFIFVLRPPQ